MAIKRGNSKESSNLILIVLAVAVVLLISGGGLTGNAFKFNLPQQYQTQATAPQVRVLQQCQFASNTAAGWKYCNCPAGYYASGFTGYNCESTQTTVSGRWGCIGTQGYTDKVGFYHDGTATAYVGVYCEK